MKTLSLTAVAAVFFVAAGHAQAGSKNFEVPQSCKNGTAEKCARSLIRSTYIFGNIAENKLGYAVIPGVTTEHKRQQAIKTRAAIGRLCKANQLKAYQDYSAASDSETRRQILRRNVDDQIECMDLSVQVLGGFEKEGMLAKGMTAKAQAVQTAVQQVKAKLQP